MHIYLIRKKKRLSSNLSYTTIYGVFTSEEKALQWISNQVAPEQFIIDEVITDTEVHIELW